eukprot:scaffold264131_cov45-Prasinocladus_malaysianus.AAC.1
MESLALSDCPAAEDALQTLYAAFCVLGSFLMPLAIMWLVAWQRLPTAAVMPAPDSPEFQA